MPPPTAQTEPSPRPQPTGALEPQAHIWHTLLNPHWGLDPDQGLVGALEVLGTAGVLGVGGPGRAVVLGRFAV